MDDEMYPHQPRDDPVSEWHKIVSNKPETSLSVLRELTTSKDVPEDFKKKMWAFVSQEDVWGNLKDRDFKIAEEVFLAAWDYYEYTLPDDISSEMSLNFLNAYHKFRLRLTRAYDGFERKQENTTIAQSQSIAPVQQRKSWAMRLFGRFGF